eukprot:5352271-Pleurochrysis_carterae.AAC.1
MPFAAGGSFSLPRMFDCCSVATLAYICRSRQNPKDDSDDYKCQWKRQIECVGVLDFGLMLEDWEKGALALRVSEKSLLLILRREAHGRVGSEGRRSRCPSLVLRWCGEEATEEQHASDSALDLGGTARRDAPARIRC